MNHTPTPWHKESGRPKVRNRSDITVADCGDYYVGSLEKRQANAAFIEKACNAHDPLLKAAKAAKAELANLACGRGAYRKERIVGPNVGHITDQLDKAIALAEGEKGE